VLVAIYICVRLAVGLMAQPRQHTIQQVGA
jgi:hypothetical protein